MCELLSRLFILLHQIRVLWHLFGSKVWSSNHSAVSWTYATMQKKKRFCLIKSVAVESIHSIWIGSNFRFLLHQLEAPNARVYSSLVPSFFLSRTINWDEKCKLLWTILKFIKIVCHKNMWVLSFSPRSVFSALGSRPGRKQDHFFLLFLSFYGRVHEHVLVSVVVLMKVVAAAPFLFFRKWIFDCNLLSAFKLWQQCDMLQSCAFVSSTSFSLFTVPFRLLSRSRAYYQLPTHRHKTP